MRHDLLIDGRFTPGSGATYPIIDPSRGEPSAEVAAASPQQVEAAVAGAVRTQPAWAALPQDRRSEALRTVAAALEDAREDLAGIVTRETGRVYSRNLLYVDYTAAVFRQYAELARVHGGRVAPSNDAGQLSLVLRVPFGVVAVLVPWNYPLTLLAFKAAPALATGNTIVIKPAPETTLATLRLAEILGEILPGGVVSVVAGGADVGERLVRHPDVHLVAFTGSTATGRIIGAACGDLTKPAHLELGGKDAALVFDDADARLAAQGVVWAAFLNAGQVCTSTERAYVHRAVYQHFLDHAADLTAGLRVGDPFDEKTQVGPMRSDAGRRRVLDQIRRARDAGAKVLVGGDPPPGPGYYLNPAVLVGVDHSMDIMREETFGPVLPVMPFDDDDEAFRLAKETPYGLGASLYTHDPARVERAYRELAVGNVWVNDPVVDNLGAPFGGMRASGNARELGLEGLYAFTAARHVHWNLHLESKSWWYPYPEEG